MASTAVAIPCRVVDRQHIGDVSIGFYLALAYWPKMPIPFFHVSVA